MRRCLLFLFVLLLATSSFRATWQSAPGVQEPEGIEELEAEIQGLLDEDDVPGACVALVARDHTIWAGGVGKADVAAGIDVTADSLFRVGSISKSFTAVAVLMLVEQGPLDLDTPIREAVPEIAFTNRWRETHPVTLAHVMEHTAGFDDIHFREYAKVDDPDITLREGLDYNPDSRQSRWKPGTHMSYCNSGPPIAAYALEKVTGRIFEDFVREHVFEVLSMENSSFHFPEDASLMAKGYQEDGVTEAHYDHIIVRPSGALNTSAKEMANFVRMMINRGTFDGTQLLKSETITRMETPKTTLAARAGFDYGYGLGNFSSVVNGHHFHGHDGGITGFVSSYAYSSDLGLGYFVSINKPSAKLSDITKLVGEYLTSGLDRPDAPTTDLPDGDLREIAGFYQEATPRMQLMSVVTRFTAIQRVTLEDGKLFVKGLIGGEKQQLVPVTATSFRLEDQPVATLFNVVDEEGDLIAQWGRLGNNEKVSGLWVLFQFAAATLSLLLMASAVLFAVVWVPAKALRRLKTVPWETPLFPLLATLSLIVALVLPVMLSSDLIADLGTRTAVSLTIYLGTLLFAALTLFSLYTSYRSYSEEMSRLVRLHAVLVTAACAVTLLYLWDNGLIGLRTWAY